eukprot:9539016-Alexandrium_andersonii.AAC.1
MSHMREFSINNHELVLTQIEARLSEDPMLATYVWWMLQSGAISLASNADMSCRRVPNDGQRAAKYIMWKNMPL